MASSSLGTLPLTAGAFDDAVSWCVLALVLATVGGGPGVAVLTIGRRLLAPLGRMVEAEGEMSRRLHCVCVVIAQDSGAVLVVQRQAMPDAMWSMPRHRDPSHLDLHPVAAFLLQDAAVQIKKRVEADVGTVHQLSNQKLS